MIVPKKAISWITCLVLIMGATGGVYAYRAYSLWHYATDLEGELRYLIESGGTIGEVPASEAFDIEYLSTIFGDNPTLFDQLNNLFSDGLSDKPSLNLGEVAAMIVTYQTADDGSADDVVAHVIGDFPLGERKPGLHRNGYFSQHLDEGLWDLGNTMVGFVGRDMILFGNEEAISYQRQLLESVMTDGEIGMLVEHLSNTVHYTAVFPDPKRIVPSRLRNHIRAVVIKGSLGHYEGDWECIVLTRSRRSAVHTLRVARDCNEAAKLALKTRWEGVEKDKPWGKQIDPWWSYELAQAIDTMAVSNDQNLVRMRMELDRVMVNVVLKTIERAGRDVAQMRASLGDKKDPRVVDAELQSDQPSHYWSTPHRWGPDWPIGAAGPHTGLTTNQPSSDQISPDTEPLQGNGQEAI